MTHTAAVTSAPTPTFAVLNVEALTLPERERLDLDVRGLWSDMNDDACEDAAPKPRRKDAERELLRRIGGAKALGRYVATLMAGDRRSAPR